MQQQAVGMPPFSSPAGGTTTVPSPVSSRPPEEGHQEPASFEHEPAGDEGERGGSAGNRWPRQETLALLKIRSEMDAAFREAALKGPLWEEVSRKLAAAGYNRSAKKCREKFENVQKYYKRTKEGRAGRQDGKSYRFFSELEALHAASQQQQQQQLPPPAPTQLQAFVAAPVMAVPAPQPMNSLPPLSSAPMQPAPISAAAPAPAPLELPPHQPLNLQGFSFSSMSDDSDSDNSDSDDDMTEETEADRVGSKRKRGGSRKMMSFFEGLMQQVVERQEEMQRRFLETMEKREAERTAHEEAWRRQEVARLNREHDQLAQERAAAASRDATIIAFLQRVGHHPAQVHPPTTSIAVAVPMPAPPQMQLHTVPKQPPPRQQPAPLPPSQASTPLPVKPILSASPLQQQPPHQHKETPLHHHDATTTPRSAPPTSAASSLELVPAGSEQHYTVDYGLVGGGMDSGAASSSRWPKAEVQALIQLRMEMDMRYNEMGPKGPLWEEISAGMRRLGYNRSSKRCKEKWENINKYYKKVKESNKKRPEDSKTCPYFHQLEAIYRKKQLTGGTVNVAATPTAAFPTDQVNQSSNRQEIEGKSIDDDKRNSGGSSAAQVPTSNGETSPTVGLDGSGTKKPEDIVRELSEQRPPHELTTDETDSDGEYTDDGEEAEDDGQLQYRIQFQRPNSAAATAAPAAPATTAAPPVQASPPTTTNTFATMVQ